MLHLKIGMLWVGKSGGGKGAFLVWALKLLLCAFSFLLQIRSTFCMLEGALLPQIHMCKTSDRGQDFLHSQLYFCTEVLLLYVSIKPSPFSCKIFMNFIAFGKTHSLYLVCVAEE